MAQHFILRAHSLYCCSVFRLLAVRLCLTGDKLETSAGLHAYEDLFPREGKGTLAREGVMRPEMGQVPQL